MIPFSKRINDRGLIAIGYANNISDIPTGSEINVNFENITIINSNIAKESGNTNKGIKIKKSGLYKFSVMCRMLDNSGDYPVGGHISINNQYTGIAYWTNYSANGGRLTLSFTEVLDINADDIIRFGLVLIGVTGTIQNLQLIVEKVN